MPRSGPTISHAHWGCGSAVAVPRLTATGHLPLGRQRKSWKRTDGTITLPIVRRIRAATLAETSTSRISVKPIHRRSWYEDNGTEIKNDAKKDPSVGLKNYSSKSDASSVALSSPTRRSRGLSSFSCLFVVFVVSLSFKRRLASLDAAKAAAELECGLTSAAIQAARWAVSLWPDVPGGYYFISNILFPDLLRRFHDWLRPKSYIEIGVNIGGFARTC
jgi:hypothetical protein